MLQGDALLSPEPVDPPALAVRDGRVVALGEAALEHGAPRRLPGTIAPALIDIQVNGGDGVDLQAPEPDRRRLHAWLREGGVLTYVPTLVSAPVERLAALAAGLAGELDGVLALMPHLEGPFISTERLGAHSQAAVAACTADSFGELAERWAGLVTLAPERGGAVDLIQRLVQRGIPVAVGHSDATFEEAEAGFRAGATAVTHLFNAMRPFHHRDPGLVGAALAGEHEPWVGLIADGVHVAPQAVTMTVKLLGRRLVLVSDSVAAAGVTKAASRLPDGTLAGSVARLDECVKNLITWGVPAPAALRAATFAPAAAVGVEDRGALEPGRLALISHWDQDWRVLAAGDAEALAAARVPA